MSALKSKGMNRSVSEQSLTFVIGGIIIWMGDRLAIVKPCSAGSEFGWVTAWQ